MAYYGGHMMRALAHNETFSSTWSTAIAMECRLYRGDVGRTRMRQLKIARVDICALLWVAALFVVIIALKHFGL